MFKRQTAGSVVCASCGMLVGVNDPKCYHCGRRNPGLWGFAPLFRNFGNDMGFVPLVIFGCSAIYLLTLVWPVGGGMRGGGLDMLSPSGNALLVFGASGAAPVFGYGRWWTVLSAGWLHASVLHILLNMYSVRQLAPGVAQLYGPGRMALIYVAGGVSGFIVSSLAGEYLSFIPIPFLRGGTFTVGASASVCGLLGAVAYYGRRGGSQVASSIAWTNAVIMLVMGVAFAGIDNYAHAGGFLGGYLTGRFLDPLMPERIDHVVAAVGCLVLSAVAIAASVITVYWP
jgi:rhomboid protease GluP